MARKKGECKLYYALAQLTSDFHAIRSAGEVPAVRYFRQEGNDFDLMEHCHEMQFGIDEFVKPSLVWGLLMPGNNKITEDDYCNDVYEIKNSALLCIDEDKKYEKPSDIEVSCYEDIILYRDDKIRDRIPFAAYMYTNMQFSSSRADIYTLWPAQGGSFLLGCYNRPFVLSCRGMEPFAEGTTIENWKEQIPLKKIYKELSRPVFL